jgi:CheY-like chemotaxis protein/multidrug efflux pump subunit AcrA (membrane-fusion protein)
MPSTERRPTILVVDDDTTLLDVLGRVLKREGLTVVHGAGVAEALEVADSHTPDLALLDLSLPDGDGVSLAGRLHERHPDLPLILMTAYPIRLREDPTITNRFRRVMIKPLNLDELREAVREALRGEPATPSVGARPETRPQQREPAPQPGPAEADASLAPAPVPLPHDRWHWLKSGAMVVVALLVLAAFVIYIAGVPIPGLSSGAETTTQAPPDAVAVDLVKDRSHTISVPDDVKKALGILKGDKDETATAVVPTEARPLVLTASTALDPDQILHVRVRFTPAKVVQIGPAGQDPELHERRISMGAPPRELRVGDRVHRGDLLGVFYSDAVGSQKNALFDAESQWRLDHAILTDAMASSAAVKTFIDNAMRNVEADLNHSNQAANTLRTWGIPEKDIQKIIDEAHESRGDDTRITKEKYEDWGRVEVRADMDGVIVERSIPEKELIQDPTLSLFQLATVDHVQVIANASEDDLKTLVAKQQAGKRLVWSIQTVNGPEKDPATGKDPLFPIDDIGYLVDPIQHSAVVKGYVPNPEGKMRGAQLVTASIPLDPPDDVVEVDVRAIADDGSGRTYVFVQAKDNKSFYTLRRVKVTHRFDKVVYVKSRLDAREAALTPQEMGQGLLPLEPLHEGDRVLKSGVLELKKELEDRESDAGK